MSAWELWSLWLALVLIPLLAKMYLLAAKGSTEAVADVLTPSETGMLISDERAVLAALAQLRAANIIDRRGRLRSLDAAARRSVDDFTVQVHRSYSAIQSPRLIALTAASSEALADLRLELAERQLIVSDELRRILRGGTMALWVGAAIVVGVSLFRYDAIWAVAATAVLGGALAVWAADREFRDLRRNSNSKRVLKRAYIEHKCLHPNNQPALSSYGPRAAGFAAALYGGASLWLLDGAFAQAIGAPAARTRGEFGSSSSGGCGGGGFFSGDGGGSGGDGGGSGGGGGCGGGGS